jgi:probable HAF family extracellular repeat protein
MGRIIRFKQVIFSYAIVSVLVISTGFFEAEASMRRQTAFIWNNGVMTSLKDLAGGPSVARDINDAGLVVGQSLNRVDKNNYDIDGLNRSVLWSNGEVTGLFGSGSRQDIATGINNAGQIVGIRGNLSKFGYLLSNGETTAFGTNIDGSVNDINDASQFVGAYIYEAYIYDKEGNIIDIDSERSGSFATLWTNGEPAHLKKNAVAHAINELGHVVGGTSDSRALLWINGIEEDLGEGVAYGINDIGQVVGDFDGNAFLWEKGMAIEIGTLGGEESFAYDINNTGQVVGASTIADGSLHAFIWENGIMTDLGEGEAFAINNAGQVVGSYNPVPLPGAVFCMGSGLVMLVTVGRKKNQRAGADRKRKLKCLASN